MNLPASTAALRRPALSSTQESPFVKWLLIAVAGLLTTVFLLLPLLNVFVQAFSSGLMSYWRTLAEKDTVAAILVYEKAEARDLGLKIDLFA